MTAIREAMLGGLIAALAAVLVAVPGRASVPDECCVCEDNCPSAGTRACFQVSSEPECQSRCESLGCGTAVTCIPAASCTEISFCDETGEVRCADGLDNNANGLTDCAESSCLTEPSCIKEAPAVAWPAAAGLAALLALGGMWRMRRRPA